MGNPEKGDRRRCSERLRSGPRDGGVGELVGEVLMAGMRVLEARTQTNFRFFFRLGVRAGGRR